MNAKLSAQLFDARITIYLYGISWFPKEFAEAAGLSDYLADEERFPEHFRSLGCDRSSYLQSGAITLGLLEYGESFERLFRRPGFAEMLEKADAEWAQRTGRPALRMPLDWSRAAGAAGFAAPASGTLEKPTIDATVAWAIEQLANVRNAGQPEQTWSKVMSPAEAGVLFGIATKTFVRLVQDKKIRVKKLSNKAYQIDLRDMPTTKRS